MVFSPIVQLKSTVAEPQAQQEVAYYSPFSRAQRHWHPQYSLPMRQTFVKKIPEVCDLVKPVVRESFGETKGTILS